MASPSAFVPWKEVVFFALLLLAFNVSARELVGTNIVARTVHEMTIETNVGRRLIARQLDTSWGGNYSPPPPRRRPPPPPCRYTPRPSLPRSRPGSRPLPPR
ncbi:hypothetical protein SDJN02_04878 [Cucurbita argyrosperma subsp. argyrosperma]|nr:hypothetical protein SDJN02_04878 [Cucurbita argyrosperma subsp. argyrosperma]